VLRKPCAAATKIPEYTNPRAFSPLTFVTLLLQRNQSPKRVSSTSNYGHDCRTANVGSLVPRTGVSRCKNCVGRTPLLDDLIRAGEQHGRDGESKRAVSALASLAVNSGKTSCS
jgi:hypothetical protein